MATRSERPRVKSKAASIAKGADGTSKVRTFGWKVVRHRIHRHELWEQEMDRFECIKVDVVRDIQGA